MIQLTRLAAVALLTFGAGTALACPGQDAKGQACDCTDKQAAEKPAACDHGQAAPAKAEAAAFGAKMHLNDGKKWSVDTHTKTAGAQLRKTIEAAKVDTLEGGQAAAKQLSDDLNGLIRGCTMKGPDHDMLHVFLSEFMPAVSQLANAANVNDAKAQFTTIKQGIDAFDAHFE
jgi:hypothetical protein